MAGNVVERLVAFNQHRNPQLIQRKYQAMRANAFAFLRGTCHLFYEDWPTHSALNEAPLAWICGDLHPDNFGSYKGDNRLAYFDINDFDEAALAPCTWDAVRFATSVLVGAPLINASPTQATALIELFVTTYASRLADGSSRTVERATSTGLVKDLLESLKLRKRREFLDAHTRRKGGKRRLVIDEKHYLPIDDTQRDKVTKAVESLGTYREYADFFKVLDMAHRIAGTGSLGVDRYVILVEGRGSPDQNFLLDMKEERPSSLQPYLTVKQPTWSNEAERTVAIQKRCQGTPPALLTTLKMDHAAYVLHELQPYQDRVDYAAWAGRPRRLEKLVQAEAEILAWDQLRSGGRQGSAIADDLIAFGQARGWQAALADYAQKYAGRVEEDYHEFSEAYDKGKLSPV